MVNLPTEGIYPFIVLRFLEFECIAAEKYDGISFPQITPVAINLGTNSAHFIPARLVSALHSDLLSIVVADIGI